MHAISARRALRVHITLTILNGSSWCPLGEVVIKFCPGGGHSLAAYYNTQRFKGPTLNSYPSIFLSLLSLLNLPEVSFTVVYSLMCDWHTLKSKYKSWHLVELFLICPLRKRECIMKVWDWWQLLAFRLFVCVCICVVSLSWLLKKVLYFVLQLEMSHKTQIWLKLQCIRYSTNIWDSTFSKQSFDFGKQL